MLLMRHTRHRHKQNRHAFNQITRNHTLHLSGTPFKALANDKFLQDAIFNYTYADEQNKKRKWNSPEQNPYANLPQLNLFTYQMSEIVRDELSKGKELKGETVEYAFDLNEFFATSESGKFLYDSSVDRFLDALPNPLHLCDSSWDPYTSTAGENYYMIYLGKEIKPEWAFDLPVKNAFYPRLKEGVRFKWKSLILGT